MNNIQLSIDIKEISSNITRTIIENIYEQFDNMINHDIITPPGRALPNIVAKIMDNMIAFTIAFF